MDKKNNGLDKEVEFNFENEAKMSLYTHIKAELPGIKFHSDEKNENKILTLHIEYDMNEFPEESANNVNELNIAENINTTNDTEEILADNKGRIDAMVESNVNQIKQGKNADEMKDEIHNVTKNTNEQKNNEINDNGLAIRKQTI